MYERDAQTCARREQRGSRVGGSVVEVERAWLSVPSKRLCEELEHGELGLVVVGLERDDVARAVIEKRVDAKRQVLVAARLWVERGAVTDVAVPQKTRRCHLPAAPTGLVLAPHGGTIEVVLAKKALQRREAYLSRAEAAVDDERAQYHAGGDSGVLFGDVEDERSLLVVEGACVSLVLTWTGFERFDATSSKGVVPALQSGQRVAACGVAAGRAESLGRERSQRATQLASVQLLVDERADDGCAKERHALGVGARLETHFGLPGGRCVLESGTCSRLSPGAHAGVSLVCGGPMMVRTYDMAALIDAVAIGSPHPRSANTILRASSRAVGA